MRKLTVKQSFEVITLLVILICVSLVATKSYFHTKEIKLASEGCYGIDGDIILETSFLNMNYSFSCESE